MRKLTINESNLIDRITQAYKLPFAVDDSQSGVYDAESDVIIDLQTALEYIDEAIACDETLLSCDDFEAFKKLHGSIVQDINCPLGGDEHNDCDGCAYSVDYHYVDGECVRREH